MHIRFYSHHVNFSLKKKSALRAWIKEIIQKENKIPDEINYIFCDDNYLLSLNKKFLRHITLTDIITFDYSKSVKGKQLKVDKKSPLSGEIFISIPRVMENAGKFNVSFDRELHRVMIHGILHLCGYGDKTKADKLTMRKTEDRALISLYENL